MALTPYEEKMIKETVSLEYVNPTNSQILESKLSDAVRHLQDFIEKGHIIPNSDLDTILTMFKNPKEIIETTDNNTTHRVDSLARPTFREVRKHIINCIDENIKDHLKNHVLNTEQIKKWNVEQILENVRIMPDSDTVIQKQRTRQEGMGEEIPMGSLLALLQGMAFGAIPPEVYNLRRMQGNLQQPENSETRTNNTNGLRTTDNNAQANDARRNPQNEERLPYLQREIVAIVVGEGEVMVLEGLSMIVPQNADRATGRSNPNRGRGRSPRNTNANQRDRSPSPGRNNNRFEI